MKYTENIFYYFIEKGNEKAIITTDSWIGDIGDYIIYKGDSTWKIIDYAYEFYDLEQEMIYE